MPKTAAQRLRLRRRPKDQRTGGGQINQLLNISDAPVQPRALGQVALGVRHDGRSRIGTLRQSGCLKLLFPRVPEDVQAVILNTAGGVTGGDRLDLSFAVQGQAQLTVTTQAAERIYAAQPGQVGRVSARLSLAADARLDWLPQETIFFDRGALDRRLEADLAAGATLLMAETLIMGRAAMGEEVRALSLVDRYRLTRDGLPLWRDATRIDGDAVAHLAGRATGGGAGALSQAVLAAPNAARFLAPLREITQGASAAVSAIGDDLLLLRALAADAYEMRKTLIPVLELLRGAPLPRTWMI